MGLNESTAIAPRPRGLIDPRTNKTAGATDPFFTDVTDELADKVEALAYSLADLDRSAGSQTAASLEAEISKLEGDANPLDVAASETGAAGSAAELRASERTSGTLNDVSLRCRDSGG